VRNTEATEDDARRSLAAVQRPADAADRAAQLDAVTVDAMGTLVELDEPVGRLQSALERWNVRRSREQVAAAFQREVAYYLQHKLEARDAATLTELRRRCAAVFLEGAQAEIDAAAFSPAFVDSMVFRPVDGAVPALARLRAAGLALACISDWDIGLEEQLAKVGLDHLFETVLTSAEAGAPKPQPPIFQEALRRLGIRRPERAVHVGDGEGDRKGAKAAGLAFEPVPLATVPERLGVL
jgi:putative hydrolase of the HAD superfamily